MIIALNNKCNLDKQEFENYLSNLNNMNLSKNIILCPSAINISQVNDISFSLGAEDVSFKPGGANTGDISAKQLKSYNVEYCIVGHSERRQYQKETNDIVKEKIRRLLEVDIIPILCIGETKEERTNGITNDILKVELDKAFEELTEEQKSKVIIAYEPIWSIGTGIIPTVDDINQTLRFIKSIAVNNKVLYGGSANEENIDLLKTSPLIDGYLLGGLSLKTDKLNIFIEKLK